MKVFHSAHFLKLRKSINILSFSITTSKASVIFRENQCFIKSVVFYLILGLRGSAYANDGKRSIVTHLPIARYCILFLSILLKNIKTLHFYFAIFSHFVRIIEEPIGKIYHAIPSFPYTHRYKF